MFQSSRSRWRRVGHCAAARAQFCRRLLQARMFHGRRKSMVNGKLWTVTEILHDPEADTRLGVEASLQWDAPALAVRVALRPKTARIRLQLVGGQVVATGIDCVAFQEDVALPCAASSGLCRPRVDHLPSRSSNNVASLAHANQCRRRYSSSVRISRDRPEGTIRETTTDANIEHSAQNCCC